MPNTKRITLKGEANYNFLQGIVQSNNDARVNIASQLLNLGWGVTDVNVSGAWSNDVVITIEVEALCHHNVGEVANGITNAVRAVVTGALGYSLFANTTNFNVIETIDVNCGRGQVQGQSGGGVYVSPVTNTPQYQNQTVANPNPVNSWNNTYIGLSADGYQIYKSNADGRCFVFYDDTNEWQYVQCPTTIGAGEPLKKDDLFTQIGKYLGFDKSDSSLSKLGLGAAAGGAITLVVLLVLLSSNKK